MNDNKPRWWPLLVIVALYLIALLWVWQLWDAPSRQHRVVRTVVASFFSGIAGVLWLLLLSRLRWKTRLLGLVAIAAVGLILSQALTVRGVSGDLIPILAWKWSPKADETLDSDLGGAAGGRALEATTGAHDFPQYLGPNRNATLAGPALARDWSASPPEEIWRLQVGAGWSGFAVVGNRAVTLEQRGADELVVCYDLETGEVLWSHTDSARFESVLGGDGPRATPTIIDGRVYAQGATGMLNVLDLATGSLVWSKDIIADNEADVPIYGVSSSPLVHGDKVVVVAGNGTEGSLVAYARESGAKLWTGGHRRGRYSSPTLLTIAGTEQILLFYDGALRGHHPETGKSLWEFPWPRETEETSQPVPLPGDRVFLSSGYGIGSKVIQLAVDDAGAWSAELVWEAVTLKAKFTNVVVKDDTIYGLDDGILVAIDPTNGERRWKRGRFGHGHVLLVDDLLVVLSEKGEVVLIEPRPEEYVELGRFRAISGKTWNTPALAGDHLLVRNATEAACYRLPLAA